MPLQVASDLKEGISTPSPHWGGDTPQFASVASQSSTIVFGGLAEW